MPADTTGLFVEHRGSLVNYANGILHDRAGAEDVVQEAYLRFSAAAKDDHIANPVSYLYRIVRNLALDWTRRASFEAPKVATPVLEGVASDAPTAERILFYRDELRVISEALAELPERTRIAFRMYRLEGRTAHRRAAAGHRAAARAAAGRAALRPVRQRMPSALCPW